MNEPQTLFYDFGSFRIDAGKRLLLKSDGQQVSLTPKAFDTLLYLVQHSGRLLDKNELLRAVWPDAIVEENNLNQHISTLRRVLGDRRDEHRYIVTAPGRGYRFAAEVKIAGGPMGLRSIVSTGVRTIAVLPFKPLAADSRDEALELGMADTLIVRLSTSKQITVRPLTSLR